MSKDALSYSTIESLWVSAGGSKALAPVMAAIAIAESGGRPSALNNNPSTGDYSVGLWQVNYFGSLLPGRTREFGSPSALLASPAAQARAAVAIERQQGLGAWSTYSSGAYRRYLAGANYGGSGTATGGTATGGSADATDAGLFSSSKPPDCLIGFDAGVGYVCLLTKGQGRATLGALLLAAGGVITLGGLVILAAYGLRKSGALDQAAAAASAIPGAGGLGARLATASARVKRKPETTAQRTARRQAAAKAKAKAKAPAGSGAKRPAAKGPDPLSKSPADLTKGNPPEKGAT